MLNWSDDTQQYFTSDVTADALQVLMMLLTLLSFLVTWSAWLWEADSIRLPITVSIFFIIKMVSDASLALSPPTGFFMGPVLKSIALNRVNNFFVSNCDPWVGNALITFIFAFRLETRWLKWVQGVLAVITMIFVLLVLIVYKLSFSFSYFSAIIAVLFGYIFSFDLQELWEKWNVTMMSEGCQTLPTNPSVEAQALNSTAEYGVVVDAGLNDKNKKNKDKSVCAGVSVDTAMPSAPMQRDD